VTLQSSGQRPRRPDGPPGRVFGATILAPATALPELSSGIEAVRLGDHQLAVGDILGGNSFQLTLFLLADILAGTR
jgi:cation:H+ antiporter